MCWQDPHDDLIGMKYFLLFVLLYLLAGCVASDRGEAAPALQAVSEPPKTYVGKWVMKGGELDGKPVGNVVVPYISFDGAGAETAGVMRSYQNPADTTPYSQAWYLAAGDHELMMVNQIDYTKRDTPRPSRHSVDRVCGEIQDDKMRLTFLEEHHAGLCVILERRAW